MLWLILVPVLLAAWLAWRLDAERHAHRLARERVARLEATLDAVDAFLDGGSGPPEAAGERPAAPPHGHAAPRSGDPGDVPGTWRAYLCQLCLQEPCACVSFGPPVPCCGAARRLEVPLGDATSLVGWRCLEHGPSDPVPGGSRPGGA